MITIIECAVLFIDLITLCCNKLKEKEEIKNSSIKQKPRKPEGTKEEAEYGEVIRKNIQEENGTSQKFVEYGGAKTVHV